MKPGTENRIMSAQLERSLEVRLEYLENNPSGGFNASNKSRWKQVPYPTSSSPVRLGSEVVVERRHGPENIDVLGVFHGYDANSTFHLCRRFPARARACVCGVFAKEGQPDSGKLNGTSANATTSDKPI